MPQHSIPMAPDTAAELVASVQFGRDGLVPVIAQSAADQQVLMLAYADAEALINTLCTGWATYYSRSRQQQWVKGETSGNRQFVRSIHLDCDADTVLLTVDQQGPACHTGAPTCFDGRLLADSPHRART